MSLVDGNIVGGRSLATPALAAAYLRRNNPALAEAEVLAIVGAYWYVGPKVGVAADGAFAQACHETNFFKFGNQVAYSQHNPAGIGATNDGAAGLSFPDWASGVAVQFAHLLAWCGAPGGEKSPRKALVDQVAKVRGYARTWRDLGGRWAVPGTGYGDAIERHWQGILSEGKNMSTPKKRIAIASGHHNSDGGNQFEYEQTGKLAAAVAKACRARGMDARVITPSAGGVEGAGMFPGGLWDVAFAVVALANGGWVPDLFIETHTEGGGTTGVFAIYPDAAGDVDADVRDKLGALVSRKVAEATGLAVRRAGKDGIPGVCSERETGVGLGGDRLGIFNKTAPIRATTTRLIVEYGAHDKEPDLTIVKRPGFYEAAGNATAAAFAEFLGLPVDSGATKAPIEVAKPVGVDEAKALKVWAETLIPFEVRGNLAREGVVDLRQFGGKADEWLALYERVATHRLNGANYVMRLEDWDALRQAGKVNLY